jgi:hypothetical protein
MAVFTIQPSPRAPSKKVSNPTTLRSPLDGVLETRRFFWKSWCIFSKADVAVYIGLLRKPCAIRPMQKLKISLLSIAAVAAICWFHGVAFEFSAFAVLGLNAFETLSWRHFVYSGFTNLALIFLTIFALSMLTKFFSKEIDQDDAAELQRIATKMGFHGALKIARVMFTICFVYWIAVLFEHRIFNKPTLGLSYYYVFFFTLTAFHLTFLVCPKQSMPAVLFAFIISTMMCISAGGVASSRIDQSRQSVNGSLRNDSVVRIDKKGDTYVASAKEITLPTILDKAFTRLGL